MDYAETGKPGSQGESGLRPNHVIVYFHGYNHYPDNLQNPSVIAVKLDTAFKFGRGKKTIYWETTDLTAKEVGEMKGNVNYLGSKLRAFIAGVYYQETGVIPSVQEINNRIARIEAVTPRTAAELYLPRFALQDYYINQALDSSRQNYQVQLDYETHSDSTAKTIKALTSQYEGLYPQINVAWEGGDFRQSVRLTESQSKLAITQHALRDKANGQYLKDFLKQLLRSRDGGTLFILFGSLHQPMVEYLQDRYRREPISWQVSNELSPNASIMLVMSSLRRGNKVPDEDYAHVLFGDQVQHRLRQLVDERGHFPEYALNLSDISNVVHHFETQFSLDEIRRICEERVDPLEVFKSHPLSKKLSWLLS